MAKTTDTKTSLVWSIGADRNAGMTDTESTTTCRVIEGDEDQEMLRQILDELQSREDDNIEIAPKATPRNPEQSDSSLLDDLDVEKERDENGFAVVDAMFIPGDATLVDEDDVLDRVTLANLCDLLDDEPGANVRRGYQRGRTSNGERLVEQWGIENGFTVVRERTFDGCRGRRKREMPFDAAFYTPVGNALMEVLLVEYQGEQHYRPVGFFGGKKSFLRQVERDQKKKAFCQRESHLLVCVPYTAKTQEEVGAIITMSLDA